MLQVVVSDNKSKVEKQIQALECQIQRDNSKDKQIHLQAVNNLRMALDKE